MISERESMSKTDKLIAKIENYRNGNSITFSDLEQYLSIFEIKKQGMHGSHAKFSHPSFLRPFIVPVHGSTVKIAYVRKAIELVQALKDKEEGGN